MRKVILFMVLIYNTNLFSQAIFEEKICLADTSVFRSYYNILDIWNESKSQWDYVKDVSFKVTINPPKKEVLLTDLIDKSITIFKIKDCEYDGGPLNYTCKRQKDNVLVSMTVNANELYYYFTVFDGKNKVRLRVDK